MTVSGQVGPGLREPQGVWKKVFSYHPFEPELARAEGIYLYDTDGNRYMDVSGGPMAINLGHGDRRITEAINNQLAKFAYCHPTLSSRPKAELCERIGRVAPGDMNTTFLCSGGGEGVESAIKLARQYHFVRGNTQKTIMVGRLENFHGTTLGALSVTGDPKQRGAFTPLLQPWPHIRQPSMVGFPTRTTFEEYAIECARELEEAIHYAGPEHVAAFIATPVSSGEEYGLMPPPEYWQTVRDICDRYDVLLIVDEVVTGFGRTGKWFAMEHFGVQADIMVTGKGISSLYAPLAAMTVSDKVNEPFSEGGAGFPHGFTNGGHPLACAVGAAVIDILENDGLIENSAEVGAYLHSQGKSLLEHPTIANVRGQGLLFTPRMVKSKETMEFFPPELNAEKTLQSIALKNGLALYATLYGPRRPAAHQRGLALLICPPLCITREQVDEMMDRLDRSLTVWERTMGVA